jgi:hypothetical protein
MPLRVWIKMGMVALGLSATFLALCVLVAFGVARIL